MSRGSFDTLVIIAVWITVLRINVTANIKCQQHAARYSYTSGRLLVSIIFYNIPWRETGLRSRINALSEVQRRNYEHALSKCHGDCGINGMTAAHTYIDIGRDLPHIKHRLFEWY